VESSGDALTYARAMAELESCRPSPANIAMAAGGRHLAARIRRLIEPSRPAHPISGPGAAWVLTVLLLVGAGTIAIGGAQEPQGRPANAHANSEGMLFRVDLTLQSSDGQILNRNSPAEFLGRGTGDSGPRGHGTPCPYCGPSI